jgi:hypothetical protein
MSLLDSVIISVDKDNQIAKAINVTKICIKATKKLLET